MSNRLKRNIFAFTTVFLWATAFPLTKLVGDSLSTNSLSLIRCTIAACFLLIIGKTTKIRNPFSKKDIIYFFVAGLMGFSLYLILFTTGLQTLTSASSSIVIASTPIITAVAARKIYNERISLIGWLCILTAFAGVIVLLLWNGVLSINIGMIWTLGAALVFCIYNLMNRHLSGKGYTALEITTYCMIGGALSLMFSLPQAISEVASADTLTILVAVYLGLMPSATAYLLWAKAISYADKVSEVTNYMFVTPLLSTLLGFILLSEIPDFGTIIGGTIILASVICFNLKK